MHNSFINTKYETVNEIIFVYISSGMFIGGLIGFILDNTIPGNLYNIFYYVCTPYCQKHVKILIKKKNVCINLYILKLHKFNLK